MCLGRHDIAARMALCTLAPLATQLALLLHAPAVWARHRGGAGLLLRLPLDAWLILAHDVVPLGAWLTSHSLLSLCFRMLLVAVRHGVGIQWVEGRDAPCSRTTCLSSAPLRPQALQLAVAPLILVVDFLGSFAYSCLLLAAWLTQARGHLGPAHAPGLQGACSMFFSAALLACWAGPLVLLYHREARTRAAFAARLVGCGCWSACDAACVLARVRADPLLPLDFLLPAGVLIACSCG